MFVEFLGVCLVDGFRVCGFVAIALCFGVGLLYRVLGCCLILGLRVAVNGLRIVLGLDCGVLLLGLVL